MTDTLLMTTTPTDHEPPPPAPPAVDPPRPRGVLRRVLLDSGYALSAFFLALPAFVVVVTDLALGLGTVVLVVGLLVLWVAVMVARGFARLERVRLRGLLGRPAPTPAYLCAPREASSWRKVLTPLRDPQSWLDVVWSLVGLVTGTFAFSLVLTWWAAVLNGATYWFWQRYLPARGPDDFVLSRELGFGSSAAGESLMYAAFGVVALLTLPLVARLAAVVHGSLASVLLSSRAELQQQVQRVEGGRAAARAAEADSLRRLERDIHDGPQQRLVRLTMDLGRAQRQLADDPTRAQETIASALLQARETVDELRSLSRGIAPPLLVDRGLVAALEELTARAAVPVSPELDVPDDLPPHVETAVYFVVAEALTNVAKHSAARVCRVVVRPVGDGRDLEVRVEDDGTGGAHLGKGSGLAGLAQRVAAADGRLEVDSPAGGPTTVTALLPLRGGD